MALMSYYHTATHLRIFKFRICDTVMEISSCLHQVVLFIKRLSPGVSLFLRKRGRLSSLPSCKQIQIQVLIPIMGYDLTCFTLKAFVAIYNSALRKDFTFRSLQMVVVQIKRTQLFQPTIYSDEFEPIWSSIEFEGTEAGINMRCQTCNNRVISSKRSLLERVIRAPKVNEKLTNEVT